MDVFERCRQMTRGISAIVRAPAVASLRSSTSRPEQSRALRLVLDTTPLPAPDEVWWELFFIAEVRLRDGLTPRLVAKLYDVAGEDGDRREALVDMMQHAGRAGVAAVHGVLRARMDRDAAREILRQEAPLQRAGWC